MMKYGRSDWRAYRGGAGPAPPRPLADVHAAAEGRLVREEVGVQVAELVAEHAHPRPAAAAGADEHVGPVGGDRQPRSQVRLEHEPPAAVAAAAVEDPHVRAAA